MIIPEKTGWLFDPTEPRELAGILARLYEHRHSLQGICEVCAMWAHGHFSIERQCSKYLELFGSMTKQSKG